MNLYEITYVSFTFKNDGGQTVEKTKTHLVFGSDVKAAEKQFLDDNIKHKKIISILEDRSNTLGNICPELIKLRNQM